VDGTFEVKTITLEQARELAASNEVVSAIGHESTARRSGCTCIQT